MTKSSISSGKHCLGQAEIDEDRVLAIMPSSIRGKSSGVKLEEQAFAAIVTARDGKIIRTEVYSSPEAALEAAGLAVESELGAVRVGPPPTLST